MTYETKFAIGDVVKLAFPHKIETKKASFPDWEVVVTNCPGVVEVQINYISIRPEGDRFMGGVGYGYRVLKGCACGRLDVGNYFNEKSDRIQGEDAR